MELSNDCHDLRIDVEPPETIKSPSFVRLFIIARVLKDVNVDDSNTIHKLVQASDIIVKLHEQAKNILSQLLSGGIKKYMEMCYNEKTHANIIEMIFDEIILKQFEKEYENIVKYKRDNEDDCADEYQNLLFNTSDIMCLIFQHLFEAKYRNELANCSLVCSQWLYHVFNPNSIHTFLLYSLVEETSKQGKSEVTLLEKSTAVTRMWQRLSKAKKIRYRLLYRSDVEYNQLLLNRLSLMRNVESINVTFRDEYEKDIDLLKVIMQNCKDKISSFTIEIHGRKAKNKHKHKNKNKSKNKDKNCEKSKLPPLKLIHARHIVNEQLYFPIIWSKKCQTMTLISRKRLDSTCINSRWCNYVIDYCDCSGIKEFNIYSARFDSSLNPNDESTQTIFKKFGQKFVNSVDFKQLTIKFEFDTQIDPCMLLLWKALQPMIEKHNGCVNLRITQHVNAEGYQMLSDTIEEMNPKIDKLNVDSCIPTENNKFNKDNTIKMIEKVNKSNNSLEWIAINHTNIYYPSLIKKLKFPSNLGVIQLTQGIVDMREPQYDNILEVKPFIDLPMCTVWRCFVLYCIIVYTS